MGKRSNVLTRIFNRRCSSLKVTNYNYIIMNYIILQSVSASVVTVNEEWAVLAPFETHTSLDCSTLVVLIIEYMYMEMPDTYEATP